MYKRKVVITEEEEYLDLVQRAIQCDKATQQAEIHMKFIHQGNKLSILFYCENIYKEKVDEFADWIKQHYDNE